MIESKTTLGLLALWLIPGMGPRRLDQLLNTLGSLDTVFGTSIATLAGITGLAPHQVEEIPVALESEHLQVELKLIEKYRLHVTDYLQPEYPQLLREIPDAPPVLYSRGRLNLNSGLPLAFVGSRKSSYAGKSMCRKLIQRLSELVSDTVIVSGLALGIDSAAHKAALDCGLKTVAVLAGGLSSIYPAQNRLLSEKIEENGLLLTEFPVMTRPVASNFPLRNRIISGLSKGTVVVEAGERSGASITAGYTLEQNRELFALPGQADSRFALGTNRLIQKGQAKLVLKAEDILEEIIHDIPAAENQQLTLETANKDPLSEPEQKVMTVLRNGAMSQNSLASATRLPVAQLLAVLTGLELKGLVISKPGSVFEVIET